MNTVILHRAPWVVPITQPVLADGAVAVQNGRILDVGPFADQQKKYLVSRVTEHTGCALLPPLVNAHIHLELSHISIPAIDEPVTGFTDWISKLLTIRDRDNATEDTIIRAAREILLQQHELGVISIGDIGNTDLGEKLAADFPGIILHFHEILGRSQKSRKAIMTMVAKASRAKLFTAHAPYSTHPDLIQSLKARARLSAHPFPIHTAEPPSENELLSRGRGELFDFLVQRGFLDNSFQPPAGIDNLGSVQYLHDLGVLDEQTICVHCIQVSDTEIRILADTKTKVCLCPGSNRFLQVGRAPVKKFLKRGILPALGTDSRASNPEINIWHEMQLLSHEHPEVQPEDILAMATRGGGMALGLEQDYGTIEQGKKARFLAVPVPEQMQTAHDVTSWLVTKSTQIKPVWINER